MSWLSELFGGGGGEDPAAVSQRLAIQQQQQANEIARQAEANRVAQQQQFEALMATLRPPEPEPVDPRIQQREDLRSGALQSLNSVLMPGFENNYIPDTFDDDLTNTVYSEQRGKADEYLQNLLKRGVITDTGAAAGAKNLDQQGARVRTQLRDLGSSLLDAERGKISGIYDKGREAASTVDIGQTFDPNAFAKLINDNVSEFNSSFGDTFRAGIPGDLFDVSGLSAIAGGAQGAGNNAFDPAAVAGKSTDDEAKDDIDPITGKKRTSTVF